MRKNACCSISSCYKSAICGLERWGLSTKPRQTQHSCCLGLFNGHPVLQMDETQGTHFTHERNSWLTNHLSMAYLCISSMLCACAVFFCEGTNFGSSNGRQQGTFPLQPISGIHPAHSFFSPAGGYQMRRSWSYSRTLSKNDNQDGMSPRVLV